jgi:hypothetical protein
MSAAMPYVKWHGRDWLGDPLLRMVGHEARGVWIDLLCVMMQSEPYGHLSVGGKPMSNEQMARMIGVDMPTFIPLLMDIEGAGISSRTADGVLYSRRLVRDYDQFMRFSKAGKKGGGNPALRKSAPLASLSEEEARSQKPEAKGSIKGGYKPTYKAGLNGDFAAFWQAYPRKRKRKDAEKAWITTKDKPALEAILAAIESQKRSPDWTKDGGQFIPYPASWIRGGCWDDKPVEKQRNLGGVIDD